MNPKKNIVIITPSFLDYETGKLKIGGVESYIYNLSKICLNAGYAVTVLQFYDVSDSREFCFETVTCRFVPTKNNQKSFDSLYKQNNSKDTLFIIGTDQMDISCHQRNVIMIQHGIAFDIPGYMIPGFWGKTEILQKINKLLRCIKNVRRAGYAPNIVCVDYNYYNWFKTLGTVDANCNMRVIPNYSTSFISREELSEKFSKDNKQIKVIFARRFVDYRGTLLMADAVEKILEQYDNVSFTFAGEGPLRLDIERRFRGNEKVFITSFSALDSIKIHKEYDIAVVPTIFSEGTSLSLSEAMASGCVPIATHVGGMTNMILNEFNGFLISPQVDELVKCISDVLLMDASARKQMAINAYESALSSFSHSRWERQWLKMIDSI